MFKAILAATFLAISAVSAVANEFRLEVNVSGVAGHNADSATLFVFIDRGFDEDGNPIEPFGQILTLAEPNRFEQFHFDLDRLLFSGPARGFVYGSVKNLNEEVILLIPLTYFDESRLNERRDIFLNIAAQLPNIDAFRASYPLNRSDANLFNDTNVEFALLVFRHLIEGGFVQSNTAWTRIYGIFTANVSFFESGHADKVARILQFLEHRYAVDIERSERQAHFVQFYVRFLNKILERRILGRPAPEGNLEEYIAFRMRIIFEHDISLVLPQASDTLAILYEQDESALCITMGSFIIQSLMTKSQFLDQIEDGSPAENNLKRILKRIVDCAQLHYILKSNQDNASRGDLAGGVDYLLSFTEDGAELLNNFKILFDSVERLFPRREDNGNWKQIYIYYDLIRNRIGEGAQ